MTVDWFRAQIRNSGPVVESALDWLPRARRNRPGLAGDDLEEARPFAAAVAVGVILFNRVAFNVPAAHSVFVSEVRTASAKAPLDRRSANAAAWMVHGYRRVARVVSVTRLPGLLPSNQAYPHPSVPVV